MPGLASKSGNATIVRGGIGRRLELKSGDSPNCGSRPGAHPPRPPPPPLPTPPPPDWPGDERCPNFRARDSGWSHHRSRGDQGMLSVTKSVDLGCLAEARPHSRCRSSKVPGLKHYKGFAMSMWRPRRIENGGRIIAMNAKVQRPAVATRWNTLLVDQKAVAPNSSPVNRFKLRRKNRSKLGRLRQRKAF